MKTRYIEYIKEEKLEPGKYYIYFNEPDIIHELATYLKSINIKFDIYVRKINMEKSYYKFGIVIPFQKDLEKIDTEKIKNINTYTQKDLEKIQVNYKMISFENFELEIDTEKFGL